MVTGVPAGLLTGHFDKMACVVVAASRGRGSVPTGVEGDQDALTGANATIIIFASLIPAGRPPGSRDHALYLS